MVKKSKESKQKVIEIQSITEKTFESFLENNELVLIDIWASWCPPCMAQGQLFEKQGYKLLEKYPNLKIVKLNYDENPLISQWLYKIEEIPTLIIVYKQKTAIMDAGTQSIKEISDYITLHINNIDNCKK
ncbi:MAG: thioredoxin family protein [Acidithiobacillus sp.]|jgi:thiol-disulfide isomerase/thioredoxin|uniref:thioredoxin family protein n=1 Tax=Acidithiobacillus sp. TaxID=1872118 RepID=UPI0035601785